MCVMTIAIVGAAIATGFYYMNRDMAQNPKKLRESTAMVFILSTGVLALANVFGIGGGGGSPDGTSPGMASKPPLGVGGSSLRAVPLDYVIGGEPPF